MAPSSGWWSSIKRLLARIGHFQSLVLLTLLYLVVWLPAGLCSRLLADWLRLRAPAGTNWQPRAERINQPETMRDPF